MTQNTDKFVELLKRDSRFTVESYRFANEALDYAQRRRNMEQNEMGDPNPLQKECHITGQEMCKAACEFALNQYGFLARLVLANLGIRKTSDLGDIVYNLIEIGYMRSCPEDSREDFNNVLDLAAELENGFRFNMKKE